MAKTAYQKYNERTLERAEREAVRKGKNQFPLFGIIATGLYQMSGDYTEPADKRESERQAIYKHVVEALGAQGLKAKILATHADLGNGIETVSPVYVRIDNRDGADTNMGPLDMDGTPYVLYPTSDDESREDYQA